VDHRLLVFVAIASLVTVTPGADMALVARNVLRGGFRAGLRTSGGVLSGLVVWAFLSAVGIAALVAASATAFTVLKVAGAAYLIYLGMTTLLATCGTDRRGWTGATAPTSGSPSFASLYRQGLLNNLLNPKIGVFYTTFLPQFVEPGRSVLAWTLLLASIHICIGIVWLTVYVWLVARVRTFLTRPRVWRALDRVTGSVLVALGVRLAFERR
jgi:threonine/homoserine/homoserine lactone efflux protein